MTHCHNCGHAGTFVLLVELAVGVPGPTAGGVRSSSGDLSLAAQCPACDSTDVGVAPSDLVARYGASTTS